ncbi:MAG: hypothetical protein AB1772_12350 [Candidatus Zixiibacteriota bacterium]
MRRWKADEHRDGAHGRPVERLTVRMRESLESITDPRELFAEFSRLLECCFDVRKGFLAIREGTQTRFLAVASWRQKGARRNLSLLLPTVSSFFEKVAQSGQTYSENIAQFFDGNTLERRLLFDSDTVSFVLRPLKHDGELVGMLGYSSDTPEAFVAVENGALDSAFELFAAHLHTLRRAYVTA